MRKLVLAVICALVLPSAALGQDGQPDDELSGRVGIGLMLINSGNQLNPNGSKKRIRSLDSSASKELTTIPFILPQVTWDVGEPEGAKVYFTTEPAIDEVGSFSFNLGGSQVLEGFGILDGNVFFTPFEEVWKNPYLVDIGRESSNTTKFGVKLGIKRILGTPWRINLVYMNDRVDEDDIGEIEPDLARDGGVYSMNVNRSFFLSRSFDFRPSLSLRKGEYDGESNSFFKVKLGLKARYSVGRWILLPAFSYGHSSYDKINPIFDRTRRTDSFEARLLVNYLAPFGLQEWVAQGLLAASRGESNIDFYDTESVTTGLFMTWMF